MVEKSQLNIVTDLGSPLEVYMRTMVTQMLVSMTRSLRDEHLTLPQLASLHLLDIHKQMRIGEIATLLLLPMPAASRSVSEMVARGLFERREDVADRRAKTVTLSPAGRALIDAIGRRRIEEAAVAMTQVEDQVSGSFMEFFGQMIDTGMTRAPRGATPRPVPISAIKPVEKT